MDAGDHDGGALRVSGLDHIVLDSADVERSLAFYAGTLGLAGVRVEEWRRGEVPFPSVRVDEGTIIDILAAAPSGENLNHLCLVVEPTDLGAVATSGRFEVLEGPVRRFGARGTGTSLYVRDPDGNTVELRHYGSSDR
jgi:catechol 2,3-dioxygenase-like lactoylglutathione lyase family enzyme